MGDQRVFGNEGGHEMCPKNDTDPFFVGGGLGIGFSSTYTVGAQGNFGGPAEGITGKLGSRGGFGGAGAATFRFSENGVSFTPGVGPGVGASVSATSGYTWIFERR